METKEINNDIVRFTPCRNAILLEWVTDIVFIFFVLTAICTAFRGPAYVTYWVLVLGIIVSVPSLIRLLFTKYTLDEFRVSSCYKLISETTTTLPYNRIQNVTLSQGIIDKIFSVWNIVIESASDGVLVIEQISDGRKVFELIKQKQNGVRI